MSDRPTWNQYFLDLADSAATRSTCIRRKVGAVGVDAYNRVIGMGYNGAPTGMKHCTADTCIRQKNHIPSGTQLDICKAIHAEANVVSMCGERLRGGKVYCTTQPCTSCLKLLMGLQIEEIVWKQPYPDPYTEELIYEYGVPGIGDFEEFHLYRVDSTMPKEALSRISSEGMVNIGRYLLSDKAERFKQTELYQIVRSIL